MTLSRDQLLDEVAGHWQITGPQEQHRGKKQRNTDRNWVISARRFIDGLFRDSNRPIGEATQPQRVREADKRADALIKTEEIGVKGATLDRECHAALKRHSWSRLLSSL
jgi:hypothetical protein